MLFFSLESGNVELGGLTWFVWLRILCDCDLMLPRQDPVTIQS